MKLSILGGGGFRTPFVWQSLLRDRGTPRIDRVTLHDTDPDRLNGIRHICTGLVAGSDDPPALETTTSLDDALEGSDFVFAAVRIGGVEGRCVDERVALELGVLGQETTGAGGLAYALRTLPFMLDVAERVARTAPAAYVLNFTNPAGIITEAMQSVLGDRVIGICDTPSGLGRRVAQSLGQDPERVALDYVGLNHLGWLRRVLVDDRDVLPDLLDDPGRLAQLEEGQVFGPGWLSVLGVLPNEYLYYYYRNREAVAAISAAPQTRGEYLRTTQNAFFAALAARPDDAVALWRAAVENRNASYMAEAKGGVQGAPQHPEPQHPEPLHPASLDADPSQLGYAGVALGVMVAIARDEPARMILNVRNAGTVAGLPDDAVVEIPAMVDADGVHPLATPAPNLHQLGLMQQMKAVERHTIAAVRHGDRTEALQAFALHPLVDSLDVARQLLDRYIDRSAPIAAVFG